MQKMTLDEFKKSALPGLQTRFPDLTDLENHVRNNFELTDNGEPIDVKFAHRATSSAPALDPEALKSQIEAALEKALAPGRAAATAKAAANFFSPSTFNNHMNNTTSPFGYAGSTTRYLRGTDAKEKAFRWGAWALAVLGKSDKAAQFCQENGLVTKGHLEGVNTSGGVLVPEQLTSDIIDLRLEYGAFRRNAYVYPMTSDTASRPRRTGGLTAYFTGEGTAGTASSKAWDRVNLTAKKITCLSKMSSELSEDAVINVGDDLAYEVAWAFSYKEDLCGFNGDGSSTYGGIEGICPRLITINGVDDGGGLVLASGNLFSEITLADFHKVVGKCPSYARRNAKWFVSPYVHDTVMQRLVIAAGGITASDVAAGSRPTFLGYPVERVEVMPSTDANSQVAALFGDLQQSSTFGDRRGVTIAFAQSGTIEGVDIFAADEIGIRGTERFDIVNHDLGTSTAAGPIVGLITAAS